MKVNKLGNLFELVNTQLNYEQSQGLRRKFTMVDVIDYAIVLRKQLDKYGNSGEICKVQNIKSKKFVVLETDKERRHRKYLNTGK